MATDRKMLRLEIDGSWTVDDMAEMFGAIRDLYLIRASIDAMAAQAAERGYFMTDAPQYAFERWRLASYIVGIEAFSRLFDSSPFALEKLHQLSALLRPEAQLVVLRVDYASPGVSDLAGLGDIVGHIKDFLIYLIEHFRTREARRLDNEEHQLRNDALRLRNARRYLEMGRAFNLSDGQMRRLQMWVDDRQQPLVSLVSEGKIKGAHLLDEPDGGRRP